MLNNPAGRLHALLTRAVKIDGKTRARDAWCELLGISSKDTSLLLQRLGPVYALPHETKLAVLRLENIDHGRWLNWLPPLEAAFAATPVNGTWDNFTQPIRKDSATLTTLWQLDDQLGRRIPEPEVARDDLARIDHEVEDLREDVRSANINDDLKRLLLKHLLDIQEAVANYQIEGGAGVSRAVNNAIGAVIFAPHDTPTEHSLLKKFAKHAVTFSMWVRFGADVARLGDAGMRVVDWLTEAPTIEVHEVVNPTRLLEGEVITDEEK